MEEPRDVYIKGIQHHLVSTGFCYSYKLIISVHMKLEPFHLLLVFYLVIIAKYNTFLHLLCFTIVLISP